MTTEQYRETLRRMGLRQVDVAWMMGVTGKQSKRWATGKSPVPQAVHLLLLAMEQYRISPTWLRKHISDPIPYTTQERP